MHPGSWPGNRWSQGGQTMTELMWGLAAAVLVGSGATLVMDLWGLVRQHLLGVAPLNYALVGRWVLYLCRGRLRHNPIAATPAVAGERWVGWTVHYLIGVLFAVALLAIWGTDWLCRPSPGPALIVGLVTVLAPFLIMQPAMGAGLAARRTPRPGQARLQSLITHAVFGLGLYLSGLVTAQLVGWLGWVSC